MVIGGRPSWNDVYPRSFEGVLLNHDDSVKLLSPDVLVANRVIKCHKDATMIHRCHRLKVFQLSLEAGVVDGRADGLFERHDLKPHTFLWMLSTYPLVN